MINEKIKIISFLGLPASGKGTQAQILANKIGAKVLGIGDLIRDEIKNTDISDPFYASMKEKYDKGIPQNDEVVNDIVKKNIQKFGKNIIFDNFPFSEKQADLFFNLCCDIKADIPTLLLVIIDRESAIKRILSRKVCSSCETVYIDDGNQICEKCGGALVSRTDDNEETLAKRINEYIPRMEEVAVVFKKKGRVLKIDGEKSIKEVSEQIFKDLSNANII
jgi:adenylate kinase